MTEQEYRECVIRELDTISRAMRSGDMELAGKRWSWLMDTSKQRFAKARHKDKTLANQVFRILDTIKLNMVFAANAFREGAMMADEAASIAQDALKQIKEGKGA